MAGGLTYNSPSVQSNSVVNGFSLNLPSFSNLLLNRPDTRFEAGIDTEYGIMDYANDRGGLGAVKYNQQAGLEFDDKQGWRKPLSKSSERGEVAGVIGQYAIIVGLLALFSFILYKIFKSTIKT